MSNDSKIINIAEHINNVTREVDDDQYESKSYDFSRDADPSRHNDLWSDEVQSFADMQTIESLFFSEDWVYIVCDLVAQKISSQKLHVMQKQTVDGVEALEFAPNHPLQAIIDRPNEFQDYHSWMYNTVLQYTLMGNAINWYASNTKQILTLRTSQINIDFDERGELRSYILMDKSEDMQTAKKQLFSFKPDEIIHTRRPNPVSLIYGLSPFIPGRKSILFNRYSGDYLNTFYQKQATPGMIIEMDKTVNEKTMLRQLRTFELAYTGRRNQRRTMILPKGMKASTSSHTIADQKFIELVNMKREDTLALLKVPKHEVGLQESGSLGSQEHKTALANFWQATLIPTARMIEGSLNNFFAKMLGDSFVVKFDLSNVEALQDDLLTKSQVAESMLKAGLSLNEVRERVWELGASDEPGSDKPFVLVMNESAAQPAPPLAETQELSAELVETKSISSLNLDLKTLIDSRNKNWIAKMTKSLTEVEDSPAGKKMFGIAEQTLIAQAEIAASVVRQELRLEKSIQTKSEVIGRAELRRKINDALLELEEAFKDEFISTLISTVDAGYDSQLDLIINAQDAEKVEALKAQNRQRRRQILEARGIESFKTISETTTNRIMQIITLGATNNDSVNQIASSIRNELGTVEKVKGRSSTIARTETLTAVSIGQGESINDASEVIEGLKKGWLNIAGKQFSVDPETGQVVEGDGRIRDSHLDEGSNGVSGEIVLAKETFKNGLRWPRDIRSRDASETINCRCTVVMIPPGEDLEQVGDE